MNILLVEDDAGLVELINTMLEELGFSVMSAATGTEALAHLKKQTPDLMLLDYSLPDINGKELIETLIKQQTTTPPFILTTGQGDERIAVDMMKLGAMDYLIKDILFLEKLPDVIKRVIKEIESEGKLKQAEQALIESEVRFRTFMNAHTDHIFIKDDHFRYLFANEQTARFFNRTKDELIGKTDDELTKLTQVAPCQSSDKRTLLSNEQFTIEEKLGNRIFEVTKLPLQLPNNKKGIGGIMKDITERVKAEKALKVSEERLRGFMDSATDGFMLFDSELNQIDVNDAALKMTKQKREDVIGKNMLQLIPDVEKSGRYEKYIEVIRTGKPIVFNNIKSHSKFGNKYILLKVFKVGQGLGIISTDITEKKKAEDSVRKLSTAVEQSPSIIVVTNPDGELEYVNPKFTELTGYTSDEAIGQKSNILKSGEQDPAFYKKMWEIVDSGKVWRGQFHNKKKNGELFWEAASISAILNESGDVVNFIKIGEDITQQKITEAELKIALEKALESDRLKTAFLANMSHEIRTPMNGILGFVNLLNEPNLSKSQIGEYSSIINKSGNRLLNTINDIIDISKIEAGEVIVSTTETSVNTLIEELYSFFLPEANRKGLSLFVEPSLATEQLMILTDNHKLHGILTNLIKNAIKYTESGHVTFGYFIKNNFIEFYFST